VGRACLVGCAGGEGEDLLGLHLVHAVVEVPEKEYLRRKIPGQRLLDPRGNEDLRPKAEPPPQLPVVSETGLRAPAPPSRRATELGAACRGRAAAGCGRRARGAGPRLIVSEDV